jgi:hypothetical protein
LHIPQEVYDKIQHTCRIIHEVEWSGVLIYKIIGSIRDVNEFSVEVKDIFLMDKGTKAYTEYSFDDDVADYIMDNAMIDPEFMTYKLGHIHSHNSMGVFFSGTDWEELYINCANHNFYLSLIVNNRNEMVAKLVYRATPVAYKSLDENGEEYEMGSFGNETPLLVEHNCVITNPEIEVIIAEPFLKRLEMVIAKASIPKTVIADNKISYIKSSPSDFSEKKSWDNPRQSSFDKLISEKQSHIPAEQKKQEKEGQEKKIEEKKVFFSAEDLSIDIDEAFTAYIIRMGVIFPDDDLETALEILNSEGIDGDKICNLIIPNYGKYYSEFMSTTLDKEEAELLSMDEFLMTTETVIDFLCDFEDKYSFLTSLISELRQLNLMVENKWRDAVFPVTESEGTSQEVIIVN